MDTSVEGKGPVVGELYWNLEIEVLEKKREGLKERRQTLCPCFNMPNRNSVSIFASFIFLIFIN